MTNGRWPKAPGAPAQKKEKKNPLGAGRGGVEGLGNGPRNARLTQALIRAGRYLPGKNLPSGPKPCAKSKAVRD